MLSVVMLRKRFLLLCSVIMLSVIMLSVVMQSVVMLSVVAPSEGLRVGMMLEMLQILDICWKLNLDILTPRSWSWSQSGSNQEDH